METSCDETAAAVMGRGSRLLANVIASQAALHRRFGGVVPEVASRRHLETVLPVVDQALSEAGTSLAGLDAVAVTAGPGLVGSLLVGVTVARVLALALELPLVGVNHLEAHLYAHLLPSEGAQGFALPAVCLVVSGGHSDLIYWRDHGDLEVLGRTRDDAAGEAFDKVARLLGLGYPGGPALDRLARRGNAHAVSFPRAYLEEGSHDFSFSGLKTAVASYLRRVEREGRAVEHADVAASFEQACVEVLAEKLTRAAAQRGVRGVGVCGGVAANTALRREVRARAVARGLAAWIPDPGFCTDNAAMVAAAAWHALARGTARLDPIVDPNLPVDGVDSGAGGTGDKPRNPS
ncbi:MAG: tRNA (adenosine(37)-N6)-threonylcarbamoyltransferase complex transferase subunit TsaD [bacterium]|nr:tRNA (adenosine(37)-N6)-threonylcarbamoyltransferase complex transferase subunit TsaD [bacterium]